MGQELHLQKRLRVFNKMNLEYYSIKKSVEIWQKGKKKYMRGKKIDFPIMKNKVQTKPDKCMK